MRLENSEDFVDAVAQAVIDRIEEHSRVAVLVETVTQRVLELQKREREARAELAAAELSASNDAAEAQTVPT